MKILYIGHFKNGDSGWSRAATDYLLAMDSVGLDVVPRTIQLSDATPNLPKRFLELEEKSSEGCDVVIQHVLPHHLKYDGRFKKNIALCVYESGGTWLNNWASKINTMDELWVPSEFTAKCFRQGGVTIPIIIVPHTFSFPISNQTEKLDIPGLNGDYIFYTICDLNVRKNLPAIIQAFHREFTINEPVSLVIKCGKHGLPPNKVLEVIGNDCAQIKQHMKLYTNNDLYKKECVISVNLSREDLLKLHNTCHCYVNASHGEAWAIPMFEAMALGKQIICPDNMYEYINKDVAYTFPTYDGINLRCNDTFREVGSSREIWKNCSPLDIGNRMRYAYEDYYKLNSSAVLREKHAENYSYKNIGELIKGLLHAVTN